MTIPRVLAAVAGLLLIAVWISSGSLVTAVLVLVLVAGVAGLGLLVASWVIRGPRPEGEPPTADLEHVAGPADRVRRALRGLLARPWVRGDALVRAATTRLASEDALVFTPRGHRVAAPHLWVEWNTADLSEVASRWPLDVLARELVDGYVEQARGRGVRHLADTTWLHLLAGPDVPVGRVVVTAAFSRPQRTPAESACAPTLAAPAPGAPAHSASAPGAPAPGAPVPARPAPVLPPAGAARRRPGPPSGDETTTVRTPPSTVTTGATVIVKNREQDRPPSPPQPGSVLWQRVLPVLRTIRAPRRPAAPALQVPQVPQTLGVLVAETPGAHDLVLRGDRGRTMTIGRDPKVDAVVDDPGVSW